MTAADPRGRVLVVDDERHQRDILETILQSEGYETAAARTAGTPCNSRATSPSTSS